MNYPDSVQFLYALGNEIKTAKFGLERIRALLESLSNPQDGLRIVHVAGTNGKGSTCAMIESGLRAGGYRTGLFTSPHLAEPTERIRIDGEPVTSERFAAAFDRVHAQVEQLLQAGRIDLHTTYFETVTAMALLVFAEERVDWVVLEVGLGGRLDATNVVSPKLCVITQVDFDHEAFLGRSLESIAGEKAGILKPGVPAVFSRQRDTVAGVLEARARELDAPVTTTARYEYTNIEMRRNSSSFDLAPSLTPSQIEPVGTGAGSVRIDCPLAGEHQIENAATAALALEELRIPRTAIEKGIAATRWPGRLERLSADPEIIADGAHNPAGARCLAAYIKRFYSGRRVRLIYGAMRDKALGEIAGILFPLAAEVIVTAPRQARAVAPETLARVTDHPNVRVAQRLEDALALIRPDVKGGAPTFITGSLFLVAEARALFRPPDTIGAK